MLWKVSCLEGEFPGMWQRWFKNQCAAIGWPPQDGHTLEGPSNGHKGWAAARNALNEMQVGDHVVVSLRGHRVGRIGQVTGKAIRDEEWDPLVPKGPGIEHGEMGRRVYVRWDLTVGPDNHDLVIQLPSDCTFTTGELRPSVSRIRSMSLDSLKSEMDDPSNWVNLLGNFRYERAISDYIANYPSQLEDGMLQYPNSKVQERMFDDRSRLDVLLVDRMARPVVVECKQHGPTMQDIAQLRHYMQLLADELGEKPRGILVHGGAQKLSSEIAEEAAKSPSVEIVSYSLKVGLMKAITS